MNISKFLLIDAVFLFTAIPLIYLIKGAYNNFSLLRNSKKQNTFENISINLPEKRKLLELEVIAENQSSGIEFDSLIGNWKFVSVWKNGADDEDSVFSSLLRVFFANLKLKKDPSIENLLKFLITISIRFGIISLEFSGKGYLEGSQPFLPFFFNLIELKSGSNVLLSRSLKEPLQKEKSFFALIASGQSGKWLSARGQGGALILWLKD